MLQITPQMRILVAVEAVDFRKGIDSLAELCRAKLNADPFSGSVFVFRSRRATSIKILVYDGQGFWLATKRLSKGRFQWWPKGTEPARALRAHQAQLLLAFVYRFFSRPARRISLYSRMSSSSDAPQAAIIASSSFAAARMASTSALRFRFCAGIKKPSVSPWRVIASGFPLSR